MRPVPQCQACPLSTRLALVIGRNPTIPHKEAAPMSDLLPYTLRGLLSVLALLGPAGGGADTRDPKFSARRLTERRP